MPLSDASAGLSQVGGKGASLARIAAAGLPMRVRKDENDKIMACLLTFKNVGDKGVIIR